MAFIDDDVRRAQDELNRRESMAHELVKRPPPRCCQCGDTLDSNPGVTETGEPVCSESCYRAWIAHLEAQA